MESRPWRHGPREIAGCKGPKEGKVHIGGSLQPLSRRSAFAGTGMPTVTPAGRRQAGRTVVGVTRRRTPTDCVGCGLRSCRPTCGQWSGYQRTALGINEEAWDRSRSARPQRISFSGRTQGSWRSSRCQTRRTDWTVSQFFPVGVYLVGFDVPGLSAMDRQQSTGVDQLGGRHDRCAPQCPPRRPGQRELPVRGWAGRLTSHCARASGAATRILLYPWALGSSAATTRSRFVIRRPRSATS